MSRVARQVGAFLGAMLATFFLLWGGTQLNRMAHIVLPMRQDIARIPGVMAVSTEADAQNGDMVIRVRLARVPDLMATLSAIRAEIPPALGPYRLQIEDRPDGRLTALLQRDTFIVEQGLATGHFVAMENALLAAGRSAGVTTGVEMDANAVYLALFDPHHYEYAVFQKGGLTE